MGKWIFGVLALGLVGCTGVFNSTATPDCSDERTVELVVEHIDAHFQLLGIKSANDFFNQMLARQVGLAGYYDFIKIHNIRTISYDKADDSYECVATFVDFPQEALKEMIEQSGRNMSDIQLEVLHNLMLNNIKNKGEISYSVWSVDDESFSVEVDFEEDY